MLKVGEKAPAFTLPDQEGKMHSLKNYEGKWVLIYFYPKDDTPGCTKEACAIRDEFPVFTLLNAEVFGVSVDSSKSHAKFAKKYDLPFTLLADEDKKMVKEYEVWGKNKFMGREYMEIARTSFLIDTKGNIVKIYENVKPEAHAIDVLGDIKKLSA